MNVHLVTRINGLYPDISISSSISILSEDRWKGWWQYIHRHIEVHCLFMQRSAGGRYVWGKTVKVSPFLFALVWASECHLIIQDKQTAATPYS